MTPFGSHETIKMCWDLWHPTSKLFHFFFEFGQPPFWKFSEILRHKISLRQFQNCSLHRVRTNYPKLALLFVFKKPAFLGANNIWRSRGEATHDLEIRSFSERWVLVSEGYSRYLSWFNEKMVKAYPSSADYTERCFGALGRPQGPLI